MTSLDHLMIGLDKFGPDNDVLYTEIVESFCSCSILILHDFVYSICWSFIVLLFSSYQLTTIFSAGLVGDTIKKTTYIRNKPTNQS